MPNSRPIALVVAVLGLAVLLLAGCGDKKAQEEAALPAAGTPAAEAAATAMPAAGAFVSGTVVETMNSGGYTYVLLDTGDNRVWAAGPETPGLEVGQKVSAPSGMEMRDFTAKSLDRTFASILFVGALEVEGAHTHGAEGGLPEAGGMTGMTGMDKPISGANTTVAKAAVAAVAKLDGGHTVADIYAQAGQLGGQTVKVRARVVKFTPNIMGTNWVHIQDGTGDDATSDLTVTTAATVKVDDVVVVEGVLSVDKDFGAGYKYHVIIEKASVVRE